MKVLPAGVRPAAIDGQLTGIDARKWFSGRVCYELTVQGRLTTYGH
jgi:hypothetical protein